MNTRSFIRALWEHNTGESDRCIRACANVRYANGSWECPLFINVEKESIIDEHGVMCRMFERRES